MKKLLLLCLLLIPIYVVYAQKPAGRSAKPFKLPAGIAAKDYIPGLIIIKFKSGAQTSAKTLSGKQLATVKSTNFLSIQKKFPEQTASEVRTSAGRRTDIGLDRIYEAKMSRAINIETVINELLLDPNVEYAEPSYIHHTTYEPNDPEYTSGNQQHLNIIRAPQAWDIVRNSSGVIIAIVDSGSELTHPDLAANIYYNTADPINGADDDGDGFVDNYGGWDFVGASSNNIKPDNDPNVVGPDNDHGVHVSGIASAVTNNNIGVASVSFNAKLLIVKAGPDDNGRDISRGYEAIKYAADKGAKVINCSWGTTAGSSFGRDIVNYAIEKGCLIVAAAGNSNSNIPDYPAGYRGVLAVSNSQNNDIKNDSSNYGPYVSIAAPGTGIFSTLYGKSYGYESGTSMSTPLVASAAALVKARFPGLSMQQVGQLLRVTADDIDLFNPAFTGKLGKGRLNVLRALTESAPSVRIQNVVSSEVRASTTGDPDTLYFYLDLKNFLDPVTNMEVRLSASGADATVLTQALTVGSLGTSGETRIGPFKVATRPDLPSNTPVEFRVDFLANNNDYVDFDGFVEVAAKDYVNIYTNSISTSITSNGRIGYIGASEEIGEGFKYKGRQLLYEAALMVGVSPSRVSDAAKGTDSRSDEDFVKLTRASVIKEHADSIVVASQFDDSGNALADRLNITVTQLATAYKKDPRDKFAIIEYEIFNNNSFELKNAYVGLFTDWDVSGNSSNVTRFDPASRLGYVYHPQERDTYGGVKLLTRNTPSIYYPIADNTSEGIFADNDFSTEEKWQTLTSGIKSLGAATNSSSGADVSFVSGNGPFNIPASGSIKVAFALIGGNSLQDLQASATVAQQKYNLISLQPQQTISSLALETYPNPVFTTTNGMNMLRFELPDEGKVTLELYNLMGQRVRTLISNLPYTSGVHFLNYDFTNGLLADVHPGIYFYRLRWNNQFKSAKLSILR